MSNRKFSGNISGKGYYIALIACAVAIGITGYLYYRNANDTPQQLQNPTSDQLSLEQTDNDLEVVATQGGNAADSTQPTDSTKPKKPQKLVKPASGETIAPYSMEALAYNQTTRDWRTHNGMDIAAEAGTEVCAAAEGTVYTVYEDETMGMTVVINHTGGYVTEYASLGEDVKVAAGDTVTAGQTIGSVGTTALLESGIGDHVHFSVTCNGKVVDPMAFLELE